MTKQAKNAMVLSKDEQDFERIRALELALHERAASILGYAMMAPDLTENDLRQSVPTGEWLAKFEDSEEGKRAFRIAKAAWESAKDAPVFLKLAPAFLAGSMKARANEDRAPRTLNATIIQTTAPLPVFPERIVNNEDE